MAKIFIIRSCSDCPHCRRCSKGLGYYIVCDKEDKRIGAINKIPTWCQLKDYKR